MKNNLKSQHEITYLSDTWRGRVDAFKGMKPQTILKRKELKNLVTGKQQNKLCIENK